MRTSKIKKAIVTFALAATCMIGGFLGVGHKANAATNNNYKCIMADTKAKIGNYYFIGGEEKTIVKKSAKGKNYMTIKGIHTKAVTNGKYVFYTDEKNRNLYRTTLSNKKTIRLAKLKYYNCCVEHVYGGSIYISDFTTDCENTLKVFNMGKKTWKTISTDADNISGSGSRLLYKNASNGKVYLRNCYTGESTELKDLRHADNLKICGNKIAYVKYNEATNSYVVYTYNISTHKVTTVKDLGSDVEANYGGFDDNLNTYTYDDHVLIMKTGTIK